MQILFYHSALYYFRESEWERFSEFLTGSSDKLEALGFKIALAPYSPHFITVDKYHSIDEDNQETGYIRFSRYDTSTKMKSKIPIEPDVGVSYFDATDNKLKIYNGNLWYEIDTVGTNYSSRK